MKKIKIFVLLLSMITAGTIGFVSCQKPQKEEVTTSNTNATAKQDIIAVFERHEEEIKETLNLIATAMATLVQDEKIKNIICREALLKAVDNIHAVMFSTLKEECEKENIDLVKKMEDNLLNLGIPVNKVNRIKQNLTHFKAGNQDLYPRIYIPWYDSSRFNPTFWDRKTPKAIVISQRQNEDTMPAWVLNTDGTVVYTTKNKHYVENNPVWFVEVRHKCYLSNEVDKWFSRLIAPCFCKSSTDSPDLRCQKSQSAGGTDCYMIDPVTGDCSNRLCLYAKVPDPNGLNEELNQVIEQLIQQNAKK